MVIIINLTKNWLFFVKGWRPILKKALFLSILRRAIWFQLQLLKKPKHNGIMWVVDVILVLLAVIQTILSLDLFLIAFTFLFDELFLNLLIWTLAAVWFTIFICIVSLLAPVGFAVREVLAVVAIVLAAVMLWILRWFRWLRCLKNIGGSSSVSPATIIAQFWFRFPLWLGCFKWRVEMLVWCLRGFRWCLEMLVVLVGKMLT